ncbi:MAG: DNA-binding transcriptional LysR family regulator [Moritella dasanensis]|jgi:DNA-binding transcriptional LysR family regulator
MYDEFLPVTIGYSDSMYNIEQLRMFVTAAELGSFSACARRLGKVQSAVSQGISNLEVDLNLQLFDRTTRKPRLTKEGQHLLTFADAILQQMYELESASKALNNKEETNLKLVLDDGLQLDCLMPLLNSFHHNSRSHHSKSLLLLALILWA